MPIPVKSIDPLWESIVAKPAPSACIYHRSSHGT